MPLEIKHRHRHVKPKVVAICDLSGSMRYMSEFALTLTYMLQDVVAKARSFIFIDDMAEVTHHFKALQPQDAVAVVLRENRAASTTRTWAAACRPSTTISGMQWMAKPACCSLGMAATTTTTRAWISQN
ncbi:MAG: VWA domain-containing protein [Anaerolineae bacterium]|nr:VWA domain-containing protein [Anaerolineae bacterium]